MEESFAHEFPAYPSGGQQPQGRMLCMGE